jgi:hypothetical protein
MGSVFAPKSQQGKQARALLAEIERLAEEAIAHHGEVDVESLAAAIDGALDDMRHREDILRFLGAYLARCIAGSIPDCRVWDPPSPDSPVAP